QVVALGPAREGDPRAGPRRARRPPPLAAHVAVEGDPAPAQRRGVAAGVALGEGDAHDDRRVVADRAVAAEADAVGEAGHADRIAPLGDEQAEADARDEEEEGERAGEDAERDQRRADQEAAVDEAPRAE